jgi:uncharacterized protein YutE (UPF0331/DUF86 family)
MVDRDVVLAKLGQLADHIGRVRSACPATPDLLRADRDRCDLVAFNLMLAVQDCLDVASHIIADEGWRAATTLAGAFQRLGEHGMLTAETADALTRAAGLRNVVAHGYAGVDVGFVHQGATSGLIDLETFSREVAVWVRALG